MFKRLRKWLAIALALLAGLVLAALGLSRIESTPQGAHVGLRLALPQGDLRLFSFAGTGDAPALPGFLDGPRVRLAADGNWQAEWFCRDRVQTRSGREPVLEIDCDGRRHRYLLAQPATAAAVQAALPERLVVLSDIEGNLAFLDAALRELGVVDAQGRWAYGRDQLLLAGDLVDRGREAQAVLWRVHQLALEAQAAGGQVHLVLGNHEQYDLRGNPSRAHPEHLYASRQLGGFAAMYGADTMLGQWLRRQPVLVQLGPVLFAHGGISPAVAGLPPAALNQAMRDYWQGKPVDKTALEAVLGRDGVTQYRGYLDPDGPSLPAAELERVLAAYGAERVVVAHTPVQRVEALYGGRVYAVDVNEPGAASEALLFERGQPRVVALAAGRNLPAEKPPTVQRPFRLAALDDWRMLGGMLASLYTLSRLPHPY